MEVLYITKCKEYNAYDFVQKSTGKKLSLQIEFYGINKPKEGDIIAISKDLLNPESEDYVQPYAFKVCDVNINKIKEAKEYLILSDSNNKKHILKRVYG